MNKPNAKDEPEKRPKPHERTAEWIQQHPGLTAALAGGFVMLAFAGYFGYWLLYGQERSNNERQQQLDKLRAQKRIEALNRAFLEAWLGDAESANHLIDELESLGSPPSEVRMVRAALALGQGDAPAAIGHLEQAALEHPHSVAIRALLAAAYFRAGQWDRYEETLNRMENPNPTTPEDFLFKGYALARADPAAGVKELDEAVQHRDFAFPRALRAEVRIERAADTRAPDHIAAALEDSQAAKGMSKSHLYALAVDTGACTVAAAIFDEARMDERAKFAFDQAGSNVLVLQALPARPGALRAHWLYLRRARRDDEALALLNSAAEQSRDPKSAFLLATLRHQRGEVKEGLDALTPVTEGGDLAADILRAYLLAESPDGAAKAFKAYGEIQARYQTGPGPLTARTILRLLGRKAEAMKACAELRERADQTPGLAGNNFLIRVLDYNRGELAEVDFLQAANGARQRCLAHYHVALTYLADGDRENARRHFRACQDTQFVFAWEFEWSRAFLARLQADPKWPPWIPEKKKE